MSADMAFLLGMRRTLKATTQRARGDESAQIGPQYTEGA